jgi:hypothetical protein
MLRTLTYRPRRLEFEGCQPLFAIGIAAALACHKGDATLQQSSDQVGSQTGGVVLDGVTINQGSSNVPPSVGDVSLPTNRNTNAYGTVPVYGSSDTAAPSVNDITLNTDANLPAAISALNSALNIASAANTQTASLAQSAIDSNSGVSSGLQKVAAFASIIGGLYLGWKILKPK